MLASICCDWIWFPLECFVCTIFALQTTSDQIFWWMKTNTAVYRDEMTDTVIIWSDVFTDCNIELQSFPASLTGLHIKYLVFVSSASEPPSFQRTVTKCTLASEKQRRCLNRCEDVTAGSERKQSSWQPNSGCVWDERSWRTTMTIMSLCVCESEWECRPTTFHEVCPIITGSLWKHMQTTTLKLKQNVKLTHRKIRRFDYTATFIHSEIMN